jgi:hypothetical protein
MYNPKPSRQSANRKTTKHREKQTNLESVISKRVEKIQELDRSGQSGNRRRKCANNQIAFALHLRREAGGKREESKLQDERIETE